MKYKNYTIEPDNSRYAPKSMMFGIFKEEEYIGSGGTVEECKKLIDENILENLELNENLKEETAYKETNGKLFYELDFGFITQMAERMASNKGKYEPYNWQKLDNIEDLKQALFRHTLEVMKGNFEDDNREFGHLEAIACDVMMICYQLKKYKK